MDALAFRIDENHFFKNKTFFESDNYLIENADKLRKIPGVIVHGRYDVVCPPASAFRLKEAWPSAAFHIIADAGHAAFEPGIAAALVAATDAFRDQQRFA